MSDLPQRRYMVQAITRERTLINSVVCTFTDMGTAGTKVRIGQHLTLATALTQYARLFNTYHIHQGFKVWQEETAFGKQQRLSRQRKNLDSTSTPDA